MLVTALEANATVPTMDVVTEKLLHEERKKKIWLWQHCLESSTGKVSVIIVESMGTSREIVQIFSVNKKQRE